MRKYFIVAAIAVCLAIPGVASANFCPTPIEMVAPGMDQDLVHDILKAAAAQSSYDYGCLCDMYDAGDVDISKDQYGRYVVSITLADGGIGQILIDETI